MAQEISVVIKMDGIQYSEKEALQIVASLAERNSFNHHGVYVLGSTRTEATHPAKPDPAVENTEPAKKPAARKKTTRKRS